MKEVGMTIRMEADLNQESSRANLVITLIIFGILAGLVIISLDSSGSPQMEAKSTLRQIYDAQVSYYNEHHEYWGRQQSPARLVAGEGVISDGFAEIGVVIPKNTRYTYTMQAFQESFICEAAANIDDDAPIDVWVIDQSGTLTCQSNDAEQ